jgi:O-antigen ligase
MGDRHVPAPRARTVAKLLFAGHLLTVWGLALSNILLGLTVLWCVFHHRSFDLDRLKVRGELRFFLLFFYGSFFAFCVSVMVSYWPQQSLREWSGELNLLSLPLALILFPTVTELARLSRWLVVMVSLVSLQSLWQFTSPAVGDLQHRIVGPFSHYMTLSGVLLLGTCIVLGLLASERGQLRYFLWLALGLLVTVQLLTLTRGVWIALGLVLLLATRFLVGHRRWGIVVLATAAVLLWLVAGPLLRDRFFTIFSLTYPANYDRLQMATAGLRMLAEKPMFGIGPGLVEYFYPIFRAIDAPSHETAHLHNNLLQISAERGLVSLVGYLGLMTAALVRAQQQLRTMAVTNRSVVVAGYLAILGFNLAGLFEANWRDTEVQRLMLFLLACCFAIEAPGDPAPAAQPIPADPNPSQPDSAPRPLTSR